MLLLVLRDDVLAVVFFTVVLLRDGLLAAFLTVSLDCFVRSLPISLR